MTGLIAASMAVIGLSDAAWASDQSICLQTLSATGKPIFSGLKEVKVDAKDGSSTEGGEYRIYVNSLGVIAYVVATQYGEMAKKVSFYTLLNGSIHSYSATVSSYRYVEPIYAEAAKVADVETSRFIMCDDAVVRRVGFEGVSQDIASVARSILSEGVGAYNSSRPSKEKSP